MALEIKTEIVINATTEKVWEIIINFDEYKKWNPFIKLIEGKVEKGKRITVRIEPPETGEMTFRPKIQSIINKKELSWLGYLLLPGIFDGYHKFELVNNENGTTTFIQSEIFKGILVPLFRKQLNKNTKNGFIEMNKELKKLAENK